MSAAQVHQPRKTHNKILSHMIFSNSILTYSLFLLITICPAAAQADSLASKYIRVAENFAKNTEVDSAMHYYEKAANRFQAAGSTEKFVNAYNHIGRLLTRQDKYEKAKTYLNKALLAAFASLDSSHLEIANSYLHLGVIYAATEDYTQSLIYHQKALAIRLLKLGEYSGEVATSYGNIGNVHFRSKNFDKALEAHLFAAKIREKVYGKTSAEIIESYANLGNAYREKKNYRVALGYYEKALQNKITQRGQGHKDLAKYYKNISAVYYLMDNKEQGDVYKTKAEEVLKN
jgi:tetratricopeptide (TPR) repeat protein